MKFKFLALISVISLVLLLFIGNRNLQTVSYSKQEQDAFNKNTNLKTVTESNNEEWNSINSKLLSQLKTKKIDKILKRTETSSETIKIADALLKNEIYVGDEWKTVKIDNPSWEENPYKDKSWVLYYQSLDFLPYLLNAYEETGELKYLDKAQFYVFDWIQNNRVLSKSKNEFTWNDHSTANRVLNIIQFWKFYKDSNLYTNKNAKELVYSMIQHGKFLASDANYTLSNHGIMEDQALLALSITFSQLPKSNEWFDKAKTRLVGSLERDVTSEGVHKEHSPAYHTLVKGLFRDMRGYMIHYHQYEGEFDKALDNMNIYEQYLVMPNKDYPTFGDTERLKVPGFTQIPLLGEKAFKDSGVAFLRNDWKTAERPMYLMFSSAFHSTVHKQADDLSFILSYGSTDFFVDGGKYNYNQEDPYRQYFTSVFAHNSIAINDQSYAINPDKVGQSKIVNFKSTPSYSYVTGRHTLYDNIVVKRTMIYIKPSNIIIHDEILSDDENKYSQIFNIGADVTVNKISDKDFLLKSQLDSTIIRLTQLDSSDLTGVHIYNGLENPIRGWQSYSLNEKHPINSIYFDKKGKNQSYFTLLNFNEHDKIKNAYYDLNKKSYEFEMANNTKMRINIEKKN
ncbi:MULTISPECIES: heparinase II/III family protein [Priestia]|uniref:heparinase II/III family protein n=1 Tax=Priestia sp. FSL P4-0332 TaxID=2921634 RepID=UPI0030F59979